jgi:hypothetical protein
MYNSTFGQQMPEFGCDFEAMHTDYFEEFDQEIREAPIDKPYEFCGFIKNSGG